MNRETPKLALLTPRERAQLVSFAPYAASAWSGTVGMFAARYLDAPASELEVPPTSHHSLVLVNRPAERSEIRYEGVDRYLPPPAGSILVIPAGSPARWCWSGRNDSLYLSLEPRLIARVAAEAFDLDPARLTVPPLDEFELPQLRTALLAVNDELTGGAGGGDLAAESLANIVAVQLIRHLSAPRALARHRDGRLPQGKLRAVIEYIEGNLDAGPTLEQMAAVARLSPYHFARQFRRATGLPPHQYVIARRVERAKDLLQGGDSSLAQVAARVGFSDQSQLSHHFRRLVGITPGRFRSPARIA